MLQRIQTVWLVLAFLCEIALYYVSRDFNLEGMGELFLFILGCTTGLIALSIFSFNNRKRQILLNSISMVINALLVALLVYWLLNLSGGIDFPEKGIEPIFPVLSVFCLLLANRFIRRDDRLVKSVDRLR